MGNQYDVIIIGAGPGGIFCAYELMEKQPDLKVLMIEKGRSIEKRVCPKRKTKQCVGCNPCSITTGFAGAGAFSDGKLSLSPDVGGNLPSILGYDKTLELIRESDGIYLKFGADTQVYGVDRQAQIRQIRRAAIIANLKLVECPIRHLGTEEGYKIYGKLQRHLEEKGVELLFQTMVEEILVEDRRAVGVRTDKGEVYRADEIVSAVGREGADWFKQIAQLSNMLCGGKILVQTFGDFRRGRRTTEERLGRNNIIPTLKDAVPGDLSLVFPHRIMVDIEEMLFALDKVTPGIAGDETLLYGVEVKFYSNRVVVNRDFETSIEGLRAIGDGAGVTRGLQQASANGISVARSILRKREA